MQVYRSFLLNFNVNIQMFSSSSNIFCLLSVMYKQTRWLLIRKRAIPRYRVSGSRWSAKPVPTFTCRGMACGQCNESPWQLFSVF
jgi:hypothetical protein